MFRGPLAWLLPTHRAARVRAGRPTATRCSRPGSAAGAGPDRGVPRGHPRQRATSPPPTTARPGWPAAGGARLPVVTRGTRPGAGGAAVPPRVDVLVGAAPLSRRLAGVAPGSPRHRDRPRRAGRAGRRTRRTGRRREQLTTSPTHDPAGASTRASSPAGGRSRRGRGRGGPRTGAGARRRRTAERRQVDAGQPDDRPPRGRGAGHPGVTRDRVTYDALWNGRRVHHRRHRRVGARRHGACRPRWPRRPSSRCEPPTRCWSSSTPPWAPPGPTRPSPGCCAAPSGR